ncbi:MAG TPA: sugar phosphate isomerase/epimerase [Bryobacteraceae bacterium]|jgi:sugar phosphate isomerase/epimerase|nr:sugar phosphate isomerase/epimerase [Bryobacteraceae bacterium]
MNNAGIGLQHRRNFLKSAAVFGGAALASGTLKRAFAQAAPDFVNHIGLELFTVRDAMSTPADYEAVLAKIASFGYKEIEPATGYAGLAAKDFRAMIDRYGLSCPSTHSGLPAGDTIEQRLEGGRTMGLLYVENLNVPGGGAGRGRGAGAPMGARGGARAGGGGRGAGQTEETVKRQAQTLNENGKVAQKFGIKMIVHNHTAEFAPLADKPEMKPYDILLTETDPSVVAMQLDIGWASVAGQDILAMFKKHPGRFECWHVKDAMDIKLLTPAMTEQQRQQAAKLVPVGLGDVDYKTIFASASLAGMKHFCIEQDNASQWGDSVAAARVSLQGLTKMLS